MVTLLRIAAVLQLAIAAANVPLARGLRLGRELAALPPIARQIYRVQHAYIVGILVAFAALTFFFAGDLAGGRPVGTFLSGVLACFWAARVPVQLFYYDAELRRKHRAADAAFTATFAYLAVVFAAAALRGAP